MKRHPRARRMSMLITGHTGRGKSSTGNTIISKEFFSPGEDSETQKTIITKEWTGIVQGYAANVIDTVGLLNIDDKNATDKLNYIFEEVGVDAVLFVVKLQTPFHEIHKDDVDALKSLRSILGKNFWKYCIIVVTNGEAFMKSHEDKDYDLNSRFEQEIYGYGLNEDENCIAYWVEKAKGGVILFENKNADDAIKYMMVRELILKIKYLKEANYHTPLTKPRSWYKLWPL